VINLLKKSFCWKFLTLSLLISAPDHLSAQPSGGFFDKDFAKEGFFEPEKTPEPAPVETPAPTAGVSTNQTPVPVADSHSAQPLVNPAEALKKTIADSIIGNAKKSVESVKGEIQNPGRQQEFRSALDSVKQSLNQKLGVTQKTSFPKREAVGELTVADSAEEFLTDFGANKEIIRPELTLVVAANPRANFLKALDRLFYAATKRKARIKNVYIVGWNRDSINMNPVKDDDIRFINAKLAEEGIDTEERKQLISQALEAIPTSQILLEKLGLQKSIQYQQAKDLLSSRSLTHSPAWIVESPDKSITFQGSFDPIEFIDEQGFLAKELPEETRNGVPFGKLEKEEGLLTEYRVLKDETPSNPSSDIRSLNSCTRPRTRRFLVGPASLGVVYSIDVLVFKTSQIEEFPEISSYLGNKLPLNDQISFSELKSTEPMVSFIQTMPIRCLPTRLRYINEGTKQYLELLQGEAAFKSSP